MREGLGRECWIGGLHLRSELQWVKLPDCGSYWTGGRDAGVGGEQKLGLPSTAQQESATITAFVRD